MNTTTNRAEIFEIQRRMLEIHTERNTLAKEIMARLGNGEIPGINLDNLSAFARKVIPLNKEFEELSAKHKVLIERQLQLSGR